MTDNRTTEQCARLRSWAAQFDNRADLDALAPLLARDLREAADTIESLRGTLTAEQVFEVIERCVKFYEGGDYDAQEIADELNARAERTCHNTRENRWFKCSACGYGFTDLYAEDEGDINEQPRYCPNCGANAVDA